MFLSNGLNAGMHHELQLSSLVSLKLLVLERRFQRIGKKKKRKKNKQQIKKICRGPGLHIVQTASSQSSASTPVLTFFTNVGNAAPAYDSYIQKKFIWWLSYKTSEHPQDQK